MGRNSMINISYSSLQHENNVSKSPKSEVLLADSLMFCVLFSKMSKFEFYRQKNGGLCQHKNSDCVNQF